jgi:hypothetical protein
MPVVSIALTVLYSLEEDKALQDLRLKRNAVETKNFIDNASKFLHSAKIGLITQTIICIALGVFNPLFFKYALFPVGCTALVLASNYALPCRRLDASNQYFSSPEFQASQRNALQHSLVSFAQRLPN